MGQIKQSHSKEKEWGHRKNSAQTRIKSRRANVKSCSSTSGIWILHNILGNSTHPAMLSVRHMASLLDQHYSIDITFLDKSPMIFVSQIFWALHCNVLPPKTYSNGLLVLSRKKSDPTTHCLASEAF